MESAGTGIHAYGVPRATIRGEGFFERCYFTAKRELATVQHTLNGGINLVLDACILRLEIHKWNHESFPLRWMCTVSPRPRIELVAASISSTTRKPSHPSVIGFCPLWMHFTKCSP